MNQGKKEAEITGVGLGKAPEYFDLIIIGMGIAGLYTALNVTDQRKILMITKETLGRSASHMAQGGIASPIFGKTLYQDTLRAGGEENNRERVKILVEEGDREIKKLIHWGVPFDRDKEGNLLATREGGHSGRNILHCKDETGKIIMGVLEKNLQQKKNVTLLENTYVYRLTPLRDSLGLRESFSPKFPGALVSTILPDGETGTFYSPNVVIATGGIGGLYHYSTNPESSTGDGMALGESLGMALEHMEFNQFHPTYFRDREQRGFLITEALRGEGAVLRNEKGVAFMKNKHPMGDLAPRDVVARGIFEELQGSKNASVTVDISHREDAFLRKRFPKVYRKALERGYDLTRDPLPVAPASHYIMGGITVDEYGETTVPGIFAVGECACSQVHGANRLASNSLLEAVVFAARAAGKISERCGRGLNQDPGSRIIMDTISDKPQIRSTAFSWNHGELLEFLNALKMETQQVLGIVKRDTSLHHFLRKQERALQVFQEKEPPRAWSAREKRTFYEVRSRLIISRSMAKASLNRKENIGAHYKKEGEFPSVKREMG